MLKMTSVLMGAVLVVAFQANALVSSETKDVALTLGAADVSEVKFDAGSSALSDAQKKEISDVVAKARSEGNVDKIRVLAWSDKEYPMPKVKYEKGDVNLADNRAKEVRKFLKDDLGVGSVDTFNMAERPNKLQSWLKTPTAKMKNTAEAGGAAPRSNEETGIFGLKGQSSKTVIMVFRK